MLILYYIFDLIQLLYLKNTEMKSLNKMVKFFAKSVLNSIKLERPAILIIEPFKKTHRVKNKRMLSDRINNLLTKFKKMKI